jgi:molybdate transport system ATP-binding protein
MLYDNHIQLTLPRASYTLSVDIRLPPQGVTVLFGASGSGKTSVLRCVAGLERATGAGLVRIAGQTWQDDAAGLFLPTWQRSLGYVFQEASLFEHLTVQGNLRYGLRRTKLAGAAQALAQAIELLGIDHLLSRWPHQLSGGERQRVAIVRALATQPRVLLLDEPLAALDWARRQDVLPWFEKMRDELHIPMLYVTHAIDEVARLANKLVVLEQGRVQVAGPVTEVWDRLHPALGEEAAALLNAQLVEKDAQWHLMRVDFAKNASLWLRDTGLPLHSSVRLRVLARDVSITTQPASHTSIQNQLPGVIVSIAPDDHPSQALVQLNCNGALLLARITQKSVADLQLQAAMPVWAQVKSVALV